MTFNVKDMGPEKACPVYRLAYQGKVVLRDSRPGLDLEPAPFPGGNFGRGHPDPLTEAGALC